jgi:hypothetical protein
MQPMLNTGLMSEKKSANSYQLVQLGAGFFNLKLPNQIYPFDGLNDASEASRPAPGTWQSSSLMPSGSSNST